MPYSIGTYEDSNGFKVKSADGVFVGVNDDLKLTPLRRFEVDPLRRSVS